MLLFSMHIFDVPCGLYVLSDAHLRSLALCGKELPLLQICGQTVARQRHFNGL